jgi:glucose 1-dehydrogenase
MSGRFTNQVAIVTGAGQGIGKEICKQLAAGGASVILNDIEESLGAEAAREISKSHGTCVAVSGDVAEAATIELLIAKAVSQFGRLDIAVANAGITLFGDFLNYNRKDFKRVMEVNILGTFFLAQAAAKQMISQGPGGSILFMSSVTGIQAHKDLGAYGMTKAALQMLAKHLVIELGPYGINVNAIAPGATKTERTMQDKDYDKTWRELTPMGRPATPADIASTAAFLVSTEARHITGQTIIVDGGWSSVSPRPRDK